MTNPRSPTPSRRSRSRSYSQSRSRSSGQSPSRSRSRSRSNSLSRGQSPDRRRRHHRSASYSQSPDSHRGRRRRLNSESKDKSRSRGRSRSNSRTRSSNSSKSGSRSRSKSWSQSCSRSRTRSPDHQGSTKVVVERLTKNVNEAHLREIFGQFGGINDLYIPKNNLGVNRGTAYILYFSEEDAEAAITHMHEAQIDSATINVSIVLKGSKFHHMPPQAQLGGSSSSARSGRNRKNNGGGGGRVGPPSGPRPGKGSRRGADIYRPGDGDKTTNAAPRRAAGNTRGGGKRASHMVWDRS
ncbi:hypothetical protein Cpir12675_003296 [Ceratocystis pirilliformis]|uniref:RRM domain-containing protein n=1 Tax=Ceratocystis pirilliformis TaxID=259994 RepID=A0ABR3Z729_9PEZI